ncbi:MAG: hypothetical protein DI586_09175 [Micavibrio aeruginosavorus]|uniref:YcaO domain-containing protein n=1 Tax=Micavibrio aeruginosavorus TaxID=349221 RepID=A0A2W5FFA4_9BACT|nr:MAG: hypothetical protein DI586_09175 [Micavibrio aeruginosavorus]
MPMAKKVYRDGTHRVCDPKETLSKVMGLFPVFGITRLANITGLDRIGIPVISAIRPNSKSLSVSQGKGRSIAAAKISAAMEAIEGYHAENIEISGLYMSYEDLEWKKNIIEINGLPSRINQEFDVSDKIFWIPGEDLFNECEIWCPYDSVSVDFTISKGNKSAFLSDSNGLASGNTMCEAKVHGICEVIERDALAIHWNYDEAKRASRKVNKSTIDNYQCLQFIDQIENAELSCTIWDITSDISIPTYMCEIVENSYRPDRLIRPSFGSGTHLDKNIALSRALTEAAQSRAAFISGSRDDQYSHIYNHFLSKEMHRKWSHCSNSAEIDYRDRKSFDTDNIEDDLHLLLESLKNVNIDQVISVDLSRTEFEIPVCKIIIPFLEGIGSERVTPGKRLVTCN